MIRNLCTLCAVLLAHVVVGRSTNLTDATSRRLEGSVVNEIRQRRAGFQGAGLPQPVPPPPARAGPGELAKPGAGGGAIILFTHLRRAGGTTLEDHVRYNMAPAVPSR